MRKRLSKRALLLSSLFFVVLVVLYNLYQSSVEERLMKNYADFLAPHIWQLNREEIEDLAEMMFKSGRIYSLKITDETGDVFVEVSRDLKDWERHLLKIGLIWMRKHVYDVYYKNTYIGTVEFETLVNPLLIYSFALGSAVLLYFVILYYLNLKSTALELEKANSELRNLVEELENTIEELERIQEQLINSEKMASLGRLITSIAHDVNTPIGIVYTSTSELESKLDHLEKSYRSGRISKRDFEDFLTLSKQLLSLMKKNAKRVVDLVRSLKNVAAQDVEGRPIKFNLRDYIKDILETFRPRLKKSGVQVHLECPENLEVKSFPGALAQVISNLVENSLIHGFEGNGGNIWINVVDKGDLLEIVYRDDGRGMEENVKDKAFEPFFTTKREEGGSGLGLSIVYTLVVEKLGGEIFLKSEPGKGVEFTIIVPKRID